jgi:polyhydroxyalkanoate synthesis regulator phasin
MDDLNASLSKRMDDLNTSLSRRMDEMNANISSRLDDIIARLGRIEIKLEGHEDRITRLEERTSPLRR